MALGRPTPLLLKGIGKKVGIRRAVIALARLRQRLRHIRRLHAIGSAILTDMQILAMSLARPTPLLLKCIGKNLGEVLVVIALARLRQHLRRHLRRLHAIGSAISTGIQILEMNLGRPTPLLLKGIGKTVGIRRVAIALARLRQRLRHIRRLHAIGSAISTGTLILEMNLGRPTLLLLKVIGKTVGIRRAAIALARLRQHLLRHLRRLHVIGNAISTDTQILDMFSGRPTPLLLKGIGKTVGIRRAGSVLARLLQRPRRLRRLHAIGSAILTDMQILEMSLGRPTPLLLNGIGKKVGVRRAAIALARLRQHLLRHLRRLHVIGNVISTDIQILGMVSGRPTPLLPKGIGKTVGIRRAAIALATRVRDACDSR